MQLRVRGLGCGGSDIAQPGCTECSVAGAAEPQEGASVRLSCALWPWEMPQGQALPCSTLSRDPEWVRRPHPPTSFSQNCDSKTHVCGGGGIKGLLKVMIHPMGMSKYYRSSSAEYLHLAVN